MSLTFTIVENGAISAASILQSAPFREISATKLSQRFFSRLLSTTTPRASRVKALTSQWTVSTATCSDISASTVSKAVFSSSTSRTTSAQRSTGPSRTSSPAVFTTQRPESSRMTSSRTSVRSGTALAVKSRKTRRSCCRTSSTILSRKSFALRATAGIWTMAI